MNENQPVDSANVAQLVAVALRLSMEVSVLRDRLRTHETLLAKAGLLAPATVDAYLPDAAETAERDAFRRALITGVAADIGPQATSQP